MSHLIRGLSDNGGVVFCGIDSTEIVRTAEKLHTTSATCSAALGRLLTGAALMGSMLKDDRDTITLREKYEDTTYTFTVDGVHPHDISEILASDGVAIRAGHHCAQPLLSFLKHPSTARASLAFYNTEAEVDRLLDSISTLRERMGYGK